MWIRPRLADVGYNAMLEKSLRRNTTVPMFTLDRIYSDLLGIGSTMVWIHSIYTGLVGNKNSMILYCITFVSGPIWYQIADLIHTGSTRSHIKTQGLSVPISYQFQTDPLLCKHCLYFRFIQEEV